jgi:hypothetical protein
MGKVLVRKSVEFYAPVGEGAQIPLTSKKKEKELPMTAPTQRDPITVDAARRRAAEAQQELSEMMSPAEFGPKERAELQRQKATREREAKAGEYRSQQERYGGESANRLLNRAGRKHPLTDPQKQAIQTRAERAGRVGVLGRRIGAGLSGALAGLSALTALEQAGASGQGLETGLGSAGIRAMGTYQTASPTAQAIGGYVGSRLGERDYAGMREKAGQMRQRAGQALSSMRRSPVAVAQPTASPSQVAVQQPFSATRAMTDFRGATHDQLAARQAQLNRMFKWTNKKHLPQRAEELTRLEGEQKQRLNRTFNPAVSLDTQMLFTPPMSPVPDSNQNGTTQMRLQIPGMPAPPTPASPSPTTTQQKITTDPTEQAQAFGVKPPQGGVGATEEGAKLATEFSGEKQKMGNQSMAGDQS